VNSELRVFIYIASASASASVSLSEVAIPMYSSNVQESECLILKPRAQM